MIKLLQRGQALPTSCGLCSGQCAMPRTLPLLHSTWAGDAHPLAGLGSSPWVTLSSANPVSHLKICPWEAKRQSQQKQALKFMETGGWSTLRSHPCPECMKQRKPVGEGWQLTERMYVTLGERGLLPFPTLFPTSKAGGLIPYLCALWDT